MIETLRVRLAPLPGDPLDEVIAADRVRGDHELNPASAPPSGKKMRPAAVLVPIVDRPEGQSVLLTRRTPHLTKHAGQISFPGGRMEASDANPVETALRETEEEVGLDRGRIDVIGVLQTYLTVTGFSVTPVVGRVTPPFALTADPNEVAEIFEVPLAFLMDPANHRRHSGFYNGLRRYWHAMPYNEYYIWGATAGMLMDLYRRLDD
ncbi:CoA pyrophosphatase [Oceanibacterium hippocampi]|uniref:Putative NUDIX hydrolase n=1 Tax=Oceanibacterium hippocampi TaxID=745714 RepID=A0A1Y5S8C6_9PROT|nr:CoA pyrophosphatase [Oceanibacterium hippocampi]SLN34650.1 putative NUDIX hydrolase [Oceanibacterium hippocampi]